MTVQSSVLDVEIWRGAENGSFQEFKTPQREHQTVLDLVTEIQRDRPTHRVDDDKYERRRAKPEPDERQRQQRDRRQRVEHGGECGENACAEGGGDREGREQAGK